MYLKQEKNILQTENPLYLIVSFVLMNFQYPGSVFFFFRHFSQQLLFLIASTASENCK